MGFTDFLGGSKTGSNLIIWVLIFVAVFGFGKGKKFRNFKFKAEDYKKAEEEIHHGHRQKKYGVESEKAFEKISFENVSNNALKGMLGNNGIFILVIVALLFLCKDNKKNTSEQA